ncbi:hypothetical protein C8J57DRAFT_1250304 [Mycena rebaudengoi]|nr:hypothetical protein C8J57DRAFT_1250304 [Mycena rebaudengoi]
MAGDFERVALCRRKWATFTLGVLAELGGRVCTAWEERLRKDEEGGVVLVCAVVCGVTNVSPPGGDKLIRPYLQIATTRRGAPTRASICVSASSSTASATAPLNAPSPLAGPQSPPRPRLCAPCGTAVGCFGPFVVVKDKEAEQVASGGRAQCRARWKGGVACVAAGPRSLIREAAGTEAAANLGKGREADGGVVHLLREFLLGAGDKINKVNL